jgi:hypothetical protein
LVDALASGASGLTAVKVRVLSWAPLVCSQLFAPLHKWLKILEIRKEICPPLFAVVCWYPLNLLVYLLVYPPLFQKETNNEAQRHHCQEY